MQEIINNLLSMITSYDYSVVLNIYVFVGIMFVLSVFFVYGVYRSMPQSGFSKESTVDFVSVGIIAYLASALLLIGNVSDLVSIKFYFTNQFWYVSILSAFYVIFLLSLANRWSKFKVLDVFSPATLRFLGRLFIVVFIFFQIPFFLISGIFLVLVSRSIKTTLKNKFTSLFGLIKVEKADEYSFIGGAFLLSIFFITSICLVGVFLMYSGRFSYWYLVVLIVLLLVQLLTFVKRSRKFKLKWHLQINLLKSKNKDLKKKEEKQLKTLLD